MSTSHQRRPDGKTPDARAKVKPDVATQAEIDKLDAQKKALEQRGEKGDAAMDAELAARLQPSMGNAALAGLLNRGTDTASSSAGEAAFEEKKRDEEKEEDREDKEAGEVEHVLPSFSTGGGGGGGGQPPWAMARDFGGNDDPVEAAAAVDGPRWRPMPVLPDPDDEDAEIDAVDPPEGAEDPDALDLRAASAALGDAPWRPGPLSRGLRYARNAARRAFGPETLVDADAADHALGRARAMLRFVARHGEGLDAVLLARAAAVGEACFPPAAGYAGATARALALVEVALASLPPAWATLLDLVADGRARARVENVAAEVAETAGLSSTGLFEVVLGANVEPAEMELALGGHPSAVAALALAARVEPLPTIDSWTPPPDLEPADAIDRVLAGFTGAETPEPGYGGVELGPVFDGMNRLLAALGGALVECAAAGVALAPYVSPPAIAGVLAPTETTIRRAARRLYVAGERLERAVGTYQADEVRAVVEEAKAVWATGEVARQAAFATFSTFLFDHAPAPSGLPPLLARAEAEAAAGRSEAARLSAEAAVVAAPPELEGRVLFGAGVILARAGLPATERLEEAADRLGDGVFGVGARSVAAGLALARGEWARAERHARAQLGAAQAHGLVYAAADAAITLASARAGAGLDWRGPLLALADELRAREAGAALNLLKGRWAEIVG